MCPFGTRITDLSCFLQFAKNINDPGYITFEQKRDAKESSTGLRNISQRIAYLKNIGIKVDLKNLD